MTLSTAEANERYCLFCGNAPKSGEDCVEGRQRHRYMTPESEFCGACGEAAGDCNHPDGPAYNYDLVILRWKSGRSCWPSWSTEIKYRAEIAEMLASS